MHYWLISHNEIYIYAYNNFVNENETMRYWINNLVLLMFNYGCELKTKITVFTHV